jgi:SulP family sulfate permease
MVAHLQTLSGNFKTAFTSLSFLRHEWSGAIAAFLVALPYSIGYGVIAFSPFGQESISAGIWAGLLGSFILGIAPPLAGSTPGVFSVSRASTAIVFASLMETLLSQGMSPEAAICLGFSAVAIAGIILMLLGLLRIGIIVKFVPHPVTSGIVTAAAFLIVASQLNGIVHSIIWQPETFIDNGLGAACLTGLVVTIILALKRFQVRAPAALIGILVGGAVYHLLTTQGHLILGGTYPALPFDEIDFFKPWNGIDAAIRFHIAFDLDIIENALVVLSAGGAIAVLSSLDVMIAGAVYERLSYSRANGNRDLMAVGFGNLVCGFLGGLPGAGSITCTTRCYQAGGRTIIASALSSVLLVLVAILLGDALHYVPAMVISGLLVVVGLEQVDKALVTQIGGLFRSKFLHWRHVAPDLVLSSIVVLTGMVFNLLYAIGTGILFSLIYFAFRQGRSTVRRTYRGDTTHSRTFRDHASEQHLKQYGSRIFILELGGPLFFGSTDRLQKIIDGVAKEGVDYVILDMRRVTSIDTTGVEALKGLYVRLEAEGVFLAISHVVPERRKLSAGQQNFQGEQRREHSENREIWRKLEENSALHIVPRDRFFIDMDSALAECEDRILEELDNTQNTSPNRTPLILTGLNKQELSLIRGKMKRVKFNEDEDIFKQGDASRDLYFLMRGRADVFIDLTGTDRKVRIHSLRPGTFFGEMALLDEGTRSATVTAIDPCDCYLLSLPDYQEMKQSSPDLVMKIMENMERLMSWRLREANALIRELET